MKKRNPALAALAVPLIIVPAVLATQHHEEKIFGMSADLVSGFIVGLGIGLLIFSIVRLKKKHAE